MAPETTSSSPSEVARNAANAPPVSSAVKRLPGQPVSTCAGSATTTRKAISEELDALCDELRGAGSVEQPA